MEIKVINNGIDLSVFHPKENNFKEKYSVIEEAFIIYKNQIIIPTFSIDSKKLNTLIFLITLQIY